MASGRKISPAWFLFLFAPVIAEYVGGSSSIFNPIFIGINLLLYGCGVLIIRELRAIWRKGWLSVFLMSIAYTIFEEGIMLNTLFDPLQNTVGRFLGVNWIWAVGMLIIHSLVSVFLPIFFVETFYPEAAHERWTTSMTLSLVSFLFLFDTFIMGTLIAPHNRPSGVYYVVEFLIIALCLVLARFITVPARSDFKIHSPRWYYIATLSTFALLIMAEFILPAASFPAPVIIVVMLAAYFAFVRFLIAHGVFSESLSGQSRFAVAAGMITFWILISFVKLLGGFFSPAIVAIFIVAFLFRMKHRIPVATA